MVSVILTFLYGTTSTAYLSVMLFFLVQIWISTYQSVVPRGVAWPGIGSKLVSWQRASLRSVFHAREVIEDNYHKVRGGTVQQLLSLYAD